jgi:hypothetical protein
MAFWYSVDLGDHSGLSMTWKVNLPAGSNVVFSLLDSAEEEAWSGSVSLIRFSAILAFIYICVCNVALLVDDCTS